MNRNSQDACARRLEALLREHPEVNPDSLVLAVRRVLQNPEPDPEGLEAALRGEIAELSSHIAQARRDIAALRPADITREHIPAAGEELEAIVGATEEATNSIMEATEAIEAAASQLRGAPAAQVNDEVTRIYEACGFQDITGQRITRVVNCLTHIETKVEAILATLVPDAADSCPDDQAEGTQANSGQKTAARDPDLMNGPQAPGKAISQDDIDAILSGSG